MADDIADEPSDESADRPVARRAKSAKKTESRRSGTIVVWAIAAVAIAWGVYENRRAAKLAESLSTAQADHAAAAAKATELEQRLAATSSKLDELAKLKMPVSIVFRRTASGSGFNAFFKNNAPEPINVSVLLTNPATNRRRESNLAILANSVQEIGESQGWIFTPGQRILMTHAQFGSVEYVVPEQ